MIIELEDKLTASIHLSNLQDQINAVPQSDFQRKLFFTICKLMIEIQQVLDISFIYSTVASLCLYCWNKYLTKFNIIQVSIPSFMLNINQCKCSQIQNAQIIYPIQFGPTIYDNPLILLTYFACYSVGQLVALNKYVQRCQFYCLIFQIILICVLFMETQQDIIVLIAFIIKSLINGYMNQGLQMIRFQLIKISVNVGYLITIVFSLIGLVCKRFEYSLFRFICVAEFCLIVIFLKQFSHVPPLMEECLDNEFDIYIKYIEKCAESNSVLNYEEYKNSNEQISIIQTFQVKVHRPTMRKLFTKLSKINEQIYKYFICSTLQGFLFYSNLTYMKYFNSDNSNKYIDIMLLSFFGALSKPFYQFMTGLYTQKQVYQISQSICILSQLLKLSYIYLQSDVMLLIASLLQGVFHYNITTDIRSDYRTMILGLSQVCRHLGGMFMAYSVYDFLHEQLWEFLFVQLIVAQIMLCYFGFQTKIQF